MQTVEFAWVLLSASNGGRDRGGQACNALGPTHTHGACMNTR